MFAPQSKFAHQLQHNKPASRSTGSHFRDNRQHALIQQQQQNIADKQSGTNLSCQLTQVAQRKANPTGLPDQLKSGIESLSGYAMDDVNVHYNSSRPAQLQALAYAQGNDIHLAPGQERHLPHEAWHVVQQKQGRVRPTIQTKRGESINNDVSLEHEADVMGSKALRAHLWASAGDKGNLSAASSTSHAPVQRVTQISFREGNLRYWAGGPHYVDFPVGIDTDAYLDPFDPRTGSRTGNAPMQSPYTNGNWPLLYQGHLLNANLGGQAIAQNLFPVTPLFNGLHSSIVEDNVKANLLNLAEHQQNPATQANYINRRIHYQVEVLNNHMNQFRPANISDTVFRCTSQYTLNNNGPGQGNGFDPQHNHFVQDIRVPPPPNDFALNAQLENLNWGPAANPTYQVGQQIAPNVFQVVDPATHNPVPNMTIRI